MEVKITRKLKFQEVDGLENSGKVEVILRLHKSQSENGTNFKNLEVVMYVKNYKN
jgi:hypothetical protein